MCMISRTESSMAWSCPATLASRRETVVEKTGPGPEYLEAEVTTFQPAAASFSQAALNSRSGSFTVGSTAGVMFHRRLDSCPHFGQTGPMQQHGPWM